VLSLVHCRRARCCAITWPGISERKPHNVHCRGRGNFPFVVGCRQVRLALVKKTEQSPCFIRELFGFPEQSGLNLT
jgi:hypothetical protein